jgi:hypothetical protein
MTPPDTRHHPYVQVKAPQSPARAQNPNGTIYPNTTWHQWQAA